MLNSIQQGCSPCRYITLQDLLKQVIQGLVGVGDEQGALARAVVVKHMHDLHCCVCFACSWGPYHHGQSRLHARLDCFHLCACACALGKATRTEVTTACTLAIRYKSLAPRSSQRLKGMT